MRRALFGFFLTLLSMTLYAGEVWPQFRGPGSSGISEEDPRLPDQWSASQGVAWTLDTPGQSWSSPVVWRDKIFLTSAVPQGQTEPMKKGLYFGGERRDPGVPHQWKVTCIDFDSGKVLWEKVARESVPPGPKHLKNSYASETPVIDGERVYAYFGNAGLFAYDVSGELLWSKTWDPVKTQADWGTAASPVLHQDRLYVLNDNETKSFLLALNKKTGEEIWRVDREEKSNWSTPFVWENAQRTEIVTAGTGKTRSYDLNGTPLWELSGASEITIPTSLSHQGLLYVASGFIMSKEKPIYAIRPGAQGDISLKDGETSNAFIAWCQPKAAPYNPSILAYKGLIYVLLDSGALSCYDAKTGAPLYEKQRLPKGNAYTVSPWAYNDKIFCLSEDGDTHVIQAGPSFKVLQTNSLNDTCMASPAIANGSLILRTAAKLYRIGPM